jgi:hypothetical protein
MKNVLMVFVLSLSGCSTLGGFFGASGQLGPIAVSADGESTVTLRWEDAQGEAPKCLKPVEVQFKAPEWGTACAVEVPIPPAADGVCR